MLDERLICHASQNPTHPFVYGFYLYYLVPRQTDDVILGENAPTDTHMHGLIGKDMLWNGNEDFNDAQSASIDIDGLVQGCSISIALAMEILQSCTKPLICA